MSYPRPLHKLPRRLTDSPHHSDYEDYKLMPLTLIDQENTRAMASTRFHFGPFSTYAAKNDSYLNLKLLHFLSRNTEKKDILQIRELQHKQSINYFQCFQLHHLDSNDLRAPSREKRLATAEYQRQDLITLSAGALFNRECYLMEIITRYEINYITVV